MNTGRTRFTSGIGRTLLGALALVALVAFATPQVAQASTAANSVITNTVTVNYKNTSGVAQTPEEASVDVTVQLVVTTPTLSEPGDDSTNYGTAKDYSYTLTSTANGSATYNLTASITGQTDITNSSVGLSTASLTLGATTLVVAPDGTSDTITVPYDGTNDSVVNGIAAGETVVINNVVYTVKTGGITENPATNLATIQMTGTVASGAGIGDIVGEQQTFTLTVTPGTDPTAENGATITVQVSAGDSGSVAVADTDDTTTTVTVTDATLTVTKEVSTDGGTTFAGSASANPGDRLTYRITVTNDSSYINAASVVITDPEPQFTTYVGGSAKTTTTGAVYGSATGLTDANAGDDGYDFNVTTDDTATYSFGTLAPSETVILYFQVDID